MACLNCESWESNEAFSSPNPRGIETSCLMTRDTQLQVCRSERRPSSCISEVKLPPSLVMAPPAESGLGNDRHWPKKSFPAIETSSIGSSTDIRFVALSSEFINWEPYMLKSGIWFRDSRKELSSPVDKSFGKAAVDPEAAWIAPWVVLFGDRPEAKDGLVMAVVSEWSCDKIELDETTDGDELDSATC